MLRVAFFFAILISLMIPAVSIICFLSPALPRVVQDFGYGDHFAVFLVESIPLFHSDISLFVELTPAAIAAGLALFAPSSDKKGLVVASIAICLLGYSAFFYFSMLLRDDEVLYALDVIMQNASVETDAGMVEATRDLWLPILSSFASGTRIFYAIVAFSIVGIKLRPKGGLT